MSDFDINEPFNVWEDALNNERKRKQEWMNSLIRKYGFPVREENLLEKDYAMYDFLKDDLAKLEKSRLSFQPVPHGSSLDDEDMERNALRQRKQTEEDADVLKRIREESQKQNTEYAEDRTENDSEIQQAKTTLADLGYYRGKIDNMATSGFTKAINDFATDHQLNEQSLSESLDKISEKLKAVKTPGRLDFDGKYLRFIQDGKLVLVLNAMSGHPDYQNRKYQDVRDKGPLPEGSYRVKQDRIQDMNLRNAFFGIFHAGEAPGSYYSWGKTRVWLEPFSSNNMYGRNNFTIHGGATKGSAGCIDIPGHTKEFFDILRKYGKDIILNVHYDKEKL